MMKLKDIPNTVGYQFTGVHRTGFEVACQVIKGEDGLHRVSGVKFAELVGWKRLPKVGLQRI